MRYLIASILSIYIISSAQAANRPQPGDLGVQFEFFWLYPTLERNYFVIDGQPGAVATNIVGPRIDNCPSGYPAYRLEGIYAFANCPVEFRLRGTLFDQNKTAFRKISGSNLFPTIGIPAGGDNEPENYTGEATSRIKIDYYNVEGFLGQILYEGCPFFLSLNLGIEFARIDYSQRVEYIDFDDDIDLIIKDRSHYWGWGPEFLVDVSYDLPSCLSQCFGKEGTFSLRGEFRGSLLYGKDKAIFKTFTVNGDEAVEFKNEDIWRIVPVWGGRLSLNYARCICSWLWNLEVGYQALFYDAPIHQIRVLNAPIQGGTEDSYSQLGFIGPFFGVGISF